MGEGGSAKGRSHKRSGYRYSTPQPNLIRHFGVHTPDPLRRPVDCLLAFLTYLPTWLDNPTGPCT